MWCIQTFGIRGKFNIFSSISCLFLRCRGPKAIAKLDGGSDFPQGSTTDHMNSELWKEDCTKYSCIVFPLPDLLAIDRDAQLN